jgi:chaperonin GroEL (HSP60 family)
VNDDQRIGIEILRKAIQWPARLIVENAGVDGSVVVGKLIEHKDYAFGYDAQRGEYSTATSTISASSIRPRSCARRCKTPPQSPAS